MMAGMTTHDFRAIQIPAEDDEELKDVLIKADIRLWSAFGQVAASRRTSRSAMIRRFIRNEVTKHRRATRVRP